MTGDDLLLRHGVEPSQPTPEYNRVQVKIIKKDAMEIEVGGRKYKQVVTTAGYRPCSAASKTGLCDVICPYCKDGYVFVQSSWR